MPRSSLLGADASRASALDSASGEATVAGVYTETPTTLAPAQASPHGVGGYRDHTPLWRLAGIESCRAAALDLVSLMLDTGHWINDGVEVDGEPAERRLETSFPGLQDKLANLDDGTPKMVTHRLSPRRWAFAWRTGAQHGILALVRFRDGKPEPSEAEMLLVRVVCDGWLYGNSPAQAMQPDGNGGWTGVDRRAMQPQSKGFWLRVGLFASSGLLAAWLAISGANLAAVETQQHQLTSQRLAMLGDKTLAAKVGQVLAAGDYGEVQEVLSGFSALGYFTGATVLNQRGQVVAMAGAVGGQRIGMPRAIGTLPGARVLPLGQDGQSWGQLVLADTNAATGPGTDARNGSGSGSGSSNAVRVVAILAALLAGIGLVLQLRPVWTLQRPSRGR